MTTKHGLLEFERKIHSQNGEDGILEWLAPRARKKVIFEIGFEVEENNSRHLVSQHGWRGYGLDAKFGIWVTAENVNDFIKFTPGIVSIDVDGNDYWIWKALKVEPDIVCIEYNAHFGPSEKVTIPYDPRFIWEKDKHWFRGASLAALADLADTKGYQLVGCESSGNNAFFIKRVLAEGLERVTCEESYVPSNRPCRGEIDQSRLVRVCSTSDPSLER